MSLPIEKRHLQGAGNTPKVTDPQTAVPVWRLRLFYTNLSDSVNCAATFDLLVGGGRFLLAKIHQKGGTPMSVESIEQVIKRWETGQISPEQAIGKILLWLGELYNRLSKLENKRPGPTDSR
jgi:hypothetical protein